MSPGDNYSKAKFDTHINKEMGSIHSLLLEFPMAFFVTQTFS